MHDFKFSHAVTSVGQKGCWGGVRWLGLNFKIIHYIEKHSKKNK